MFGNKYEAGKKKFTERCVYITRVDIPITQLFLKQKHDKEKY